MRDVTNPIPLKTRIRGVRLAATEADVRYRRYHEVMIAPEETAIGDCVRVEIPALHAEDGRVLRSAYSIWQRPGQERVSEMVSLGTWRPIAAEVQESYGGTLRRISTGEPYTWSQAGEPGLACEIFGGVILAEEDANVAALLAEVRALDLAWAEAHREALAYENETQRLVAHAVAAAALPPQLMATETECLECGATYDEPGHVESGGMSCDRCG